jgi:hypothetical protein
MRTKTDSDPLAAERLHFLISGEAASKLRVLYSHAKPTIPDLWDRHGKAIVAQHIKAKPCTRPTGWWYCSGPQEYRRVVGGKGSGEHGPSRPGVPYWLRIPCFERINAGDPPQVESEAAFLKRHGVLTGFELKHLEAHPKLLEPVVCGPFEVTHGHGWSGKP